MSMIKGRHSRSGAAITDLILALFRLNGRLLAGGERLVQDLGLTSARWQVLGAVAMASAPQPVSHIARDMGLHRQGVQRIVNELVDEGLLLFEDNPHHRRAKLVTLTAKGARIYAAASALQIPWANALAKGLPPDDLVRATQVLETIRLRLAEREDEAS